MSFVTICFSNEKMRGRFESLLLFDDIVVVISKQRVLFAQTFAKRFFINYMSTCVHSGFSRFLLPR